MLTKNVFYFKKKMLIEINQVFDNETFIYYFVNIFEELRVYKYGRSSVAQI